MKYFISCRTPNGPPSWLAPLSDSRSDQGVVQPAELLEVGDQPADLGVGVLEEGGERLLEAGGEAPLVLGQRVPGLDPRVARGELGVRWEQAHLELAGEPPVAGDVPALVEASAVPLEVVGAAPGGGRAWRRRPGR